MPLFSGFGHHERNTSGAKILSNREEWINLAYRPFLDASRSSKLLRAFYVPFLSDQYTVYANYTILKPRKAKQIRKKSGG